MTRARRRLVGVWLILAILTAAVWLQQRADRVASPPAERELGSGHALFDFTEAQLSRIEVLYGELYAVFLRDKAGAWLLHDGAHHHTAADSNSAAPHDHVADPDATKALIRQIELATQMRADQRLTPDQPLAAYGLSKPQAVILFLGRAEGGKAEPLLAELLVGDLTPSKFSYYTQRSGSPALWLVPRYRIALLLAAAFGQDRAPSLLPPTSSAQSE
jgi:hypothetical protein